MEERLKAIPLAKFLWLGMDSRKETNVITEMQQLLLKKTTFDFTFTQNKYIDVCLWLAPFRPSPAARKALLPAAQSELSLCAIFGSWVHLRQLHPSHASPGRKGTNSSFSSLVLPSARCCCRLCPHCTGVSDTFPCSSSFSWARGFPSKASCGRLHVGIQSTCPKYVQAHSLIPTPKSCR